MQASASPRNRSNSTLVGLTRPNEQRRLALKSHKVWRHLSCTIQFPAPGPSRPLASTPSPEPVYDPSAPELNIAPPAVTESPKPKHEDASEFDDAEPPYDDQDDLPTFPITHELVLKDHTKVVSALTLDPSGARVVSGSHDYDCKLWDFGGMSASAKPFKTWEPAGSYYVHDLKYSNAGDQFLCISGTSQAKLYDRDGEEKCVFFFLSFFYWEFPCGPCLSVCPTLFC